MTIEKLKIYVQKVLPLVYDDSLSYYELLCKIVSKLNEIIPIVNVTQETIISTVTDILNEMIKSGQLAELIDKLSNDLSGKIDSLSGQLNDTNNTVSKLSKLMDKKPIIFIDSYGEFIPSELYTGLGWSLNWKAGANFNANDDNTFYNWIVPILNSLDLTNYSHIMFLGGFNDRDASQESIMQGIATTVNTIKTVYSTKQVDFNKVTICVGHVGWSSTLDSTMRDKILTASLPAYHKCNSYGCCYMTNIEYVLHDYSIFREDNVHPNNTGGTEIFKQIIQFLYSGCCDVWKDYKVVPIVGGNNVSTTYNVSYRLHNDKVEIWLPYDTIQFTTPVVHSANTDITLLQIEAGTAGTRGYAMGVYDNSPNLEHYINLNGYYTTNGAPLFVGCEGVQYTIYGGFLHAFNNTIKNDGSGFQEFNATALQIRGGVIEIPTLMC